MSRCSFPAACSARTPSPSCSARSGPERVGGCADSLMLALFQPQLLGHPVDRPRQLLAPRPRGAPQLLGDVPPLVPLRAQVGDLALLGAQPVAQLAEQLL